MDKNARAGRRCDRILADIAHRFLGIPAEEFGGIGDFAARIGQRFAVLDGDEFRQPLGVAHDQFIRLAQHFGAFARLLAGPGGKRAACRIKRGHGVLDRRARNRSDLVLRCRIDDVETPAIRRFAPLAADPQIGRDVGEKIVVHGHGFALPHFPDAAQRTTRAADRDGLSF